MASTPRAHSGGLLFSVTALLVQATPIAAFEHHQQRLFPCFDDTNPPQSKRLGTNTYGGPLGMGLCPTRVQWPGRPRPHRFQPSHRNGFRRRVQLAYLHHKQVRRDRVPSQTGRKPLHNRESAGAGTRFSGDGTQNPASGYRSGTDALPAPLFRASLRWCHLPDASPALGQLQSFPGVPHPGQASVQGVATDAQPLSQHSGGDRSIRGDRITCPNRRRHSIRSRSSHSGGCCLKLRHGSLQGR